MHIDRRALLMTGLGLTFAAVQLPLAPAFAANVSESTAAAKPIERLNATLLEVMKNSQDLKFEGRYSKLQLVLAEVFDIPEMTRVAVGPTWTELSAPERAKMVDLFARYMTTMYASRFDGYEGETFEMGEVKQRDEARLLVMTKLNRKDKEPVALGYLMKGEADTWHVVDVYYNGSISQLAQLRSEFSAPLRDGGVTHLASVLETKIGELKGGA